MPSPKTRVELAFSGRYDSAPAGITWAPGRINLLGEHVDHQGGVVLPIALAQGVACAWGPRPDRAVRVVALDANAGDRFTLGQIARSGRRFADLLRGATATLESEGIRVPGVDLAVAGDLPSRSGLGSSAAYLVAVLRALLAPTGREASPAELARWVQRTEAEWGGVPCGPMDPYVSAVGLVGTPILLDCGALTHETLPWPAGVEAVPEDTHVRRSLHETPYAARRAALEEGLARVRAAGRAAGTADVRVAALPPPLRGVTRHFVTENRRVEDAVDALRRGDAVTLGRLLDEGHTSLSKDFDCSTPEIDVVAESIRAQPGVLGVRLQGAGWGGSLVVLRRCDGDLR